MSPIYRLQVIDRTYGERGHLSLPASPFMIQQHSLHFAAAPREETLINYQVAAHDRGRDAAPPHLIMCPSCLFCVTVAFPASIG